MDGHLLIMIKKLYYITGTEILYKTIEFLEIKSYNMDIQLKMMRIGTGGKFNA
jgi:hypothetical protein